MTTETRFVYDNEGRLRTEIEGEFTRHYIYSHQGIEGYEENGERFIYRKNIFGDITAIYKGATKVAEYTYDAWGNCTIILNTSGYGSRNPFRYRGYYWDEGLKMYYLMTRYYNPKTGRFINADSLRYLDPETFCGLNIYAYCNSNPIMCFDPSGHDWKSFWQGVWDFIVNWYETVMAVNQQQQQIDTQIRQEQIEIVGDVAKECYDNYLFSHNLEMQNQMMLANAPREAINYVGDGINSAWNDFSEGLSKSVTVDGVADATQGFLKSAGKPTVTSNPNAYYGRTTSPYDNFNSGRYIEYGGIGFDMAYKMFDDSGYNIWE